VATACPGNPSTRATSSPSPVRGGTLRIVIPEVPASAFTSTSAVTAGPQYALDPAQFGFYDSAEVFRCCLARTLFSYVGRPTEEGGAILRPDVAASLADVSVDGLTWTITLKRGLHYGPPLQSVEITAGDFVRAIERSLKVEPGNVAFFGVIRGAAEFANGKADSIAGLEAPDLHTLRLSLTEPAGDLGARLAVPQASPIPPNPSSPDAGFGIAQGHDRDYSRFVVSSGPYMVDGSLDLDFSKPAAEQTPLAGYMPGRSLTLVRDPSWRAQSDALRMAYADRVEITIFGTLEEDSRLVDLGRYDLVLYSGPPPHAPIGQVRRYLRAPDLRSHVFFGERDTVRVMIMNPAVPPFDDLHMRRAVNYVVDKRRLQQLAGGSIVAQIAGHLSPNSLENNLLLNYDPYATTNRREAIRKARAEMRRSGYAHDAVGRCTAQVCRGVVAETVVPAIQSEIEAHQAAAIKRDLHEIGIDIVVKALPSTSSFDDLLNPRAKLPLHLRLDVGRTLLSAADLLVNFYGPNLSDQASNGSLVGATPAQLRGWGYKVRSVPNVDDRIRECNAVIGNHQFECWAALDQYLMEKVATWVPYLFQTYVSTFGPRVVRYSFSQFTVEPALDRLALKPEA
jgi:peptide/nickel transport system substrate-binding protein